MRYNPVKQLFLQLKTLLKAELSAAQVALFWVLELGALVGHGKGAAIGAAVGGAVGAGAGVVIGKKMDKQKAELEKIEGAKSRVSYRCQ